MRCIKFNDQISVNPDIVCIPEFNINVKHNTKDNFIVSCYKDEIIIEKEPIKHTLLHSYLKIGKTDSFDFRIWRNEKIISFGTESNNESLEKLKTALNSIQLGNFKTVFSKDISILNIEEYSIIFTMHYYKFDYVIECTIQDLDNIIESDTFVCCNTLNRGMHTSSPINKHLFEKPKEKYSYYKESCKMGYNRIKDIDVALYHLLDGA